VALKAFNAFSETLGALAYELQAISRTMANDNTFFMALRFIVNVVIS
jgi:hypothetical protein